MSKGSKNTKAAKAAHHKDRNLTPINADHSGHYLFSMSHAIKPQESSGLFQMLPVLFFTAVIIAITRMASYERPMGQFFWITGENQLTDFFSYYKMEAILFCASFAIIILLYRVFIQSFYIKKSFVYIPMIVYSIFVILSYLFSDYKLFALWGWNDRFEGTLTLISYMIMLFYIINTVNSEKNVKLLVYVLAAVSTVLGLLGLTQALGHDFFRTDIGKKLITPSWFWDRLDGLNFTFKNNEIYQTVYNINYVSFYLTLLIPIFGMLFINSVMRGKEEPGYKKIVWGALFALLIFNLIGSASSGGLFGMAIVILIALIILNRRILAWRKPVAILLVITVIVGVISYDRWLPELSKAISGVTGEQSEQKLEKNNINHRIDFIETDGDNIILGYQGDRIVFTTYANDPSSLTITDSNGTALAVKPVEEGQLIYRIDDVRFNWITVNPAWDDQRKSYLTINTDEHEWNFQLTNKGPKYLTGAQKLIDLRKVPAVGWENNQSFGTGRGYIWSRSIPMLKDTVVLGHGADTYCIYFPQDDYVGKYNSGTFSNKLNIIVDKPHNLYIGYMVGTGILSVIALLVLWLFYIAQSILIYFRSRFNDSLSYTGAGIFLGICGFLAAALVNDSSVSVTPMFYGLLGTGIAVNMILKSKLEEQ